jgi:hypothetical protein
VTFDRALICVTNSKIIRAYLRLYTREQIETALRGALADHAAGVKITNHSWDGTSTGAQLTGSPDHVIEILEDCLAALDNGGTTPPRSLMTHMDFRRERSL